MPQLIDVPGMGEVEFPDGMDDDQISAAIKSSMAPSRTTGQELGRQVGLTGRAVVEGAAAIPLAAADFGVGARNLITGSNYESPSSMFSGLLDRTYGKRETGLETAAGIAGSALVGSRVPVPGVKAPAPQGFVKPPTPSQVVLQRGQDAGYVVPPSTTNPTALNKVLEGIAGKLTTAQAASAKNMGVTNKLAARALGLAEDQPISTEAIRQVRQNAAKGYDAIRSAGQISKDAEFSADLGKITAKFKGAAKDYPGLGNSEVDDIVKAIDQDSVGSDSAVDAIAILRERADDAFSSGKGSLGKAYKDASRALENLIERNLAGQGQAGAETLKKFRDARQLLAKTYTVEKALNSATGNVSATKLGQQLGRGKPLTGDLRTAGQFSQAFPKAAREFNESLPGISPLDFYATGGAAAVTNQPWYLLYPFARQATRNALLSPLGQKLAVPSAGGPVKPEIAAALASQTGMNR
jgi:hypothetical protein